MRKLLPLLLLLFALLAGCGGSDGGDYISGALGVDLSGGEILINEDSRGGFHGDGEAYVVFQFPDGDLFDGISEREGWNELPLTENLHKLLYEYHTDMLRDDSNNPRVPEIGNGYYYFYDRHSQSTDPLDDSQLFSRASFNVTLAVYDADTCTLYFYALDT